METLIIVVTADDWDLGTFADALAPSHRTSLELPEGGRYLVVSRPDSTAHAYVVLADAAAEGLFEEDWPAELIPRPPFTVFALDYRDPALAESIAREILTRVAGLVDTNFGEVLTGAQFLARADHAGPGREWWRWPVEGE